MTTPTDEIEMMRAEPPTAGVVQTIREKKKVVRRAQPDRSQ